MNDKYLTEYNKEKMMQLLAFTINQKIEKHMERIEEKERKLISKNPSRAFGIDKIIFKNKIIRNTTVKTLKEVVIESLMEIDKVFSVNYRFYKKLVFKDTSKDIEGKRFLNSLEISLNNPDFNAYDLKSIRNIKSIIYSAIGAVLCDELEYKNKIAMHELIHYLNTNSKILPSMYEYFSSENIDLESDESKKKLEIFEYYIEGKRPFVRAFKNLVENETFKVNDSEYSVETLQNFKKMVLKLISQNE